MSQKNNNMLLMLPTNKGHVMKTLVFFIVAIASIQMDACVMDKIEKVVTIKNELKENIVATYSRNSSLDSDTTLFYGSIYSVKSDSTEEIWNVALDNFYVSIYNQDSVYRLIKMNSLSGIVKKSFISQYHIVRINSKDPVLVLKNN